MNNDFSQATRELFNDNFMDWEDGRNDCDCLHHILHRISNSPYNAAPLANFRTHLPEYRTSHKLKPLHSFEIQSKLLKKTKRYLDGINYIPTKYDLDFLETNKKYYV